MSERQYLPTSEATRSLCTERASDQDRTTLICRPALVSHEPYTSRRGAGDEVPSFVSFTPKWSLTWVAIELVSREDSLAEGMVWSASDGVLPALAASWMCRLASFSLQWARQGTLSNEAGGRGSR